MVVSCSLIFSVEHTADEILLHKDYVWHGGLPIGVFEIMLQCCNAGYSAHMLAHNRSQCHGKGRHCDLLVSSCIEPRMKDGLSATLNVIVFERPYIL